MSGDPEQEYFADGMVEEIITALSRIRWFFVIARNSTFTYKGRAVDVKQVGRELGVRYVLEGSVRKAGNRIRVTAQLVEATTGNHVWAERYDRDLADIFAVQDEITERVVAAIEPELYAAEQVRSQSKPPDSLDAWECVIRALSCIGQGTRDENTEAEALCRRAIAIAPGYGRAHSLLPGRYCAVRRWSGDLRTVVPRNQHGDADRTRPRRPRPLGTLRTGHFAPAIASLRRGRACIAPGIGVEPELRAGSRVSRNFARHSRSAAKRPSTAPSTRCG